VMEVRLPITLPPAARSLPAPRSVITGGVVSSEAMLVPADRVVGQTPFTVQARGELQRSSGAQGFRMTTRRVTVTCRRPHQ
jgi:hypothetical protein